MPYWIFLDVARDPPAQPPYPHLAQEPAIVRSYDAFIAVLNARGGPAYVTFDHDLGQERSGLDCAHALIEAAMDGVISLPADFSFDVHSQNPAEADTIRGLLSSFFKHLHPFHAFIEWNSEVAASAYETV